MSRVVEAYRTNHPIWSENCHVHYSLVQDFNFVFSIPVSSTSIFLGNATPAKSSLLRIFFSDVAIRKLDDFFHALFWHEKW